MVLHQRSTRILFLGFTVFVAISVYVLVVTHHLRMPEMEHVSTRVHNRDKVAMEAIHHVLLEDFAKYDQDRDSKLSVHEFANMLRDSKKRAAQLAAAMAAEEEEARRRLGTRGSGSGARGQGGRLAAADDRVPDDDIQYDDEEPHDMPYDEEQDWVERPEEEGEGEIELDEDGDVVDAVDYDEEFGEADTSGAGAAATATTTAKTQTSDSAAAGTAAAAGAKSAEKPAAEKPAAVVPKVVEKPATDGAAAAAAAGTAAAGTAVAAAGGGGCPELSKELVAQFARQNSIMLTVADWRIFGTMGINWMKHLSKWGVDYYIVGATDVQTAQFLGHTGKHPCFKFYESSSNNGNLEYKYGDLHYNMATWRKVTVVSRIVHWGFNVLHSDVDVVWFRDPLPYFLGPALKDVDVAVSSDLISTQNPPGDDGLEAGIHQHTNFNTGVYFVKATPGGKSFMAGWAAMRSTSPHINDQVGVYQFIRGRPSAASNRMLVLKPKGGEDQAAQRYAADPDRFVLASKADPLPVSSEMRLGGLGVHMLLNGYSYFIPRLHERMNVTPLGIHMTWVPLSKEGKFHRFRDGMLYDDPPEYYDAPGLRFLTADIEAPDAPEGFNSWQETEDMIQVHLKNMPPQLKQVYRAVAVALILDRTLIFPRLRCFCFKNWFMSEQCRIPGDKVTQFPLDCALDQIFRPKVLYTYPPLETKNGPQNFTFREYSLLDNPRTPAAVKDGQVLVVPEGADAGNTTGFVKVVRIKPNLMQDDLVKALEGVKDAKVIRLRHPLQLFGGFSDQVLKASVDKFADAVTANWCCRDEPYIAKGMDRKVKMVMGW